MATFNYTVDTEPMADKISSVSKHVKATTGAVVAMQTALILAEEKAADRICENVNRGFYTLIRSQISQKVAKLQSETDAHLSQLLQYKKALLSIKNRMYKDYSTISGRYIKIFNQLNAGLKQRVFELDKPTIDFAVREIDNFFARTKYLTATIPIVQLESVADSQIIIISNIKQKSLNLVMAMKDFFADLKMQRNLNKRILVNQSVTDNNKEIYIPIFLVESDTGNTGTSTSIEIYLPEEGLSNLSRSMVKNAVISRFKQVEGHFREESHPEVMNEFSKLVLSSSKSQRIKEMTLTLLKNNHFKNN
jgi:hypothetical protein